MKLAVVDVAALDLGVLLSSCHFLALHLYVLFPLLDIELEDNLTLEILIASSPLLTASIIKVQLLFVMDCINP